MRLLGVELTRWRSRRAIVLMLVAATLLIGLVAVTTIWDTRPVSAADQASAEQLAQAEARSPIYRRELASCERDPGQFFGPGARVEDCQQVLPQAEWFVQRRTLDLAEERSSSGVAIIVLLAGLMMVMGTTFAGADWASGSVSNQMLFEPRRARVWFAKAGAVLVATLVSATVILGAYWLSLYLVAESRGISTGATVQEAIRWSAARGIALVTAGALGAYALTMLLRHTVGTLATLFAYAVGGEILIATLPFAGISQWSLVNNVFAWLNDGHEYYDPGLGCTPGEGPCNQVGLITLGDSAVFLGLLLLAVSAASVLLFRRRDIP